jgi:hypothetical protein
MAYESKAAWEAAIARFKKRGMSLEDIRKRVGFFEEGDKKFTVHSRSNEQGYEIIDRNQRNRRDKKRSTNLQPLKKSEVEEFVNRNLLPTETIEPTLKKERAEKAKQRRQRQSATIESQIDHIQSQPTARKLELQERFRAVMPGDVSANREVVPRIENREKSDKPIPVETLRQQNKFTTRSGAIRQVFQSAVVARQILDSMNQLSPLNQQSAAYGGIETKTNQNMGDFGATWVQQATGLAN